MTKTLVKHGNSYALIIDRPIMDLLKIDEKTQLEITTDGTRLTISPKGAGNEKREKIKKALKRTNDRFGEALKKLAE